MQHLQDRAKAEDTDDIFERQAFVADESNVLQHPLVQTIEAFLASATSSPPLSSSDSSEEGCGGVAISLSGGVDSMVICKILALLKPKMGFQDIFAMHIDYANRNESAREADFVEEWCKNLGIAFRKRVVSEVTRGITDRATYEVVSRNARYSFYQQVLAETKCKGVIFGHHLGDVQENVISNVMRGCSPLQLSGMEQIGMTNGVAVWRPLLEHSKEEIYDFAHTYGVPYFKDTTPSWSTRGKLRNKLVPLLIDMYGAGCLKNLSALAEASDRTRMLVDTNIYDPFMKSVKRHPCGLCVHIDAYRHQPVCFWHESLKMLMHSLSMSMVRERAVQTFVDRIQGVQQHAKKLAFPSPRSPRAASTSSGQSTQPLALAQDKVPPAGWLELRKGFNIELGSDGLLVVLCENVLENAAAVVSGGATSSSSGEKEHSQPKLLVELLYPTRPLTSRETVTRTKIGHWQIRLETDILPLVDAIAECSSKALQTPREILPGLFQYSLLLGKATRRAETDSASEAQPQPVRLELLSTRGGGMGRKKSGIAPPPSLAGMDLRLRAGLPLLVIAANEEDDAQTESNSEEEKKEEPAMAAIVRLEYTFSPSA